MKKLNSKTPTLTMEEAFENFLFAKSAQGVTQNTIASYVRVLKAFLRWARDEGLCDVVIVAIS